MALVVEIQLIEDKKTFAAFGLKLQSSGAETGGGMRKFY